LHCAQSEVEWIRGITRLIASGKRSKTAYWLAQLPGALSRKFQEGTHLDGQKFDKLTRAFATGTNRRTLLKLLGGATVAGVAGVKVAAPTGVFAQDCPGDGTPGSCCFEVGDCDQGYCVIQGDVGAAGICACTESGLGDPWLGCACLGGTQAPCGDSGYDCCGATVEDQNGVCGDVCIDPVCSELQTMCEGTDCCVEGTECGANGWCYGCYSGTQNPCGPYNEAFGADYICCTFGDTKVGAIGYCVAESECVAKPPDTGAGPITSDANWIAPAAAIGAAAAVLAYKSREAKAETEA
jgi:hypothetical protein